MAETEASPTIVEIAAEPARPEEEAPRKRRRYSKGLKGAQRMGRAANKASLRLAKAVAEGLSKYRDASEKSALKKKDGMIVDGMKNASKALGEVMRGAARVPSDLASGLDKKATRRISRAVARMFVPPFLRR